MLTLTITPSSGERRSERISSALTFSSRSEMDALLTAQEDSAGVFRSELFCI